jgi:hypothetical protein
MLNLIDLAERYILAHDISDGHADQLRRHVRLYNADLSADSLNADLKKLRAAKRADSYIRNRRIYILMLWRFAAVMDMLPDPPMSKIMRVRRASIIPRCYNAEQVAMLLGEASKLKGVYKSGIARASWWVSFIAGAWDTGLSACDTLLVDRHWLDEHNEFTAIRSKTGKIVKVGFWPSTMKLIAATFPPERDLLWPLTITREAMRIQFKKIARRAGVGGTLKLLRSGSGTSVDELHGHGERHLGNTRAIFERHYLCGVLRARLPQEIPYSKT